MVSHLSNRATPRTAPRRGAALVRTPFVIFVVAALVIGLITWGVAFSGDDAATQAAACNASPEAEAAGLKPEDADALDGVTPVALGKTRVRVLNANGQTGQAGAVAAQLSERGFKAAGTEATGNDPMYPGQDLTCHGQIRYGDKGAGAARSLSFAAPCMQLITDGRSDESVDLVLGSIFSKLTETAGGAAALDQLKAGHEPAKADLDSARSGSC